MSEMIRKQFYIHKRQQILLRRLAAARGVSEAEIVRQAIERETSGFVNLQTRYDRVAWEQMLKAVAARPDAGDQKAYEWNGEDA
jgi:hypothetical protein